MKAVLAPEEGLEAVALHEDPGEEPFCSPTDAPVVTERYLGRFAR